MADCPPKASDGAARHVFVSQQDHLTTSPAEMVPSHAGKKHLLPSGIYSNDLKFHIHPPTRETRLPVWTGDFCLPPTTGDGAISLCSSVGVNILDIKTLRTPTVTPIHPPHSNLFSTPYSPHRYRFIYLCRPYLPCRYSPTHPHHPYSPHRYPFIYLCHPAFSPFLFSSSLIPPWSLLLASKTSSPTRLLR